MTNWEFIYLNPPKEPTMDCICSSGEDWCECFDGECYECSCCRKGEEEDFRDFEDGML